MTDLSPLLSESEKTLYLTRWPEDLPDGKVLMAELEGVKKDFQLFEEEYFSFLDINFRNTLSRYPVAYRENPEYISFKGMIPDIPLSFLSELAPLFEDMRKKTLSPVSSFVREGDLILEYREVKGSSLKVNSERIAREQRGEKIVYTARKTGYILFGKSGLDIRPPLLIGKDKFSLKFLFIPIREGNQDRDEYFTEYMDNHRANYPDAPPVSDDFGKGWEKREEGYELEVLRGVPPEEGYDSRLEFPLEKQKGDKNKDQVNYHEYSGITIVPEGDFFARKVRFREGSDGRDIFGKVITAARGKDVPISLAGDIVTEEKGGMVYYRAKTTGIAHLEGTTLTLKESLVVDGAVDYHTGNINFKGDVIVRGDVKPGFDLITGGDLIIEGSVENGSLVRGAGEVRIKQGIIGKDTSVEAGKDLRCGFIQNSHVSCRGNIGVDKNIVGAVVTCRGSLTVEGKGLARKKTGVVNGSKCSSFKEMILLSVGSQMNETFLRPGFDTFIQEKITEMEEVHASYELKTHQIMESLPDNVNDVESMKKLSPEKRAKLVENLKKLKGVKQKLHQFDSKKKKMADFLYNDDAGSVYIKLEEGIKGSVTVHIGEAEELLEDTDGKKVKIVGESGEIVSLTE